MHMIGRHSDTHMGSKFYSSFDFILGLKGNQRKVDGYLYTLGNYEKTSTKAGHENMLNQTLKWDCGRTRNVQGSPKAGARAIFEQKNLAQPPCHIMNTHSVACFWID